METSETKGFCSLCSHLPKDWLAKDACDLSKLASNQKVHSTLSQRTTTYQDTVQCPLRNDWPYSLMSPGKPFKCLCVLPSSRR